MSGLEVVPLVAGIVSAFSGATSLYHNWRKEWRERREKEANQSLEDMVRNSGRDIQIEYDADFRRLGQVFARGDSISHLALMQQLITLQQTVISLLTGDPAHNAIQPVRTSSMGALGELFQRLSQAAPLARPRPSGFALSRTRCATDDAYLAYYDVQLMRKDVDCIRSEHLTDNAIAFWEECLEREELVKYPTADIVLIRQSMALKLLETSDPLSFMSALPGFEQTIDVFLPVSDGRCPHWSLLVISIDHGLAFHYDSFYYLNFRKAKLIAHHLSQLLGKPLTYVSVESPQQEENIDSGVYVLHSCATYCPRGYQRRGLSNKISMSMRGKEVDTSGWREDMLKLIESEKRSVPSIQRVFTSYVERTWYVERPLYVETTFDVERNAL